MRYVIGLLSGILGMLAGWAGLAFLVISLAGEDRDGGIAMGAFFQIGPVGGIVGFIAGVWLFWRFGIARKAESKPEVATGDASPAARGRVSWPFAIAVILIAGFLAWQGWYVFIRSPYLSHGYMTLNMQFRFPPATVLPADGNDVHIDVTEGGERHAIVSLGERWRGHDGDRPGILASASLSYKASERLVVLEMPGLPQQTWQLNLGGDPDPTKDFSDWLKPMSTPDSGAELSFQLTADQ